MKIGILVYQCCSLWNAAGVMEMLKRANKAQEYFYPDQKHEVKFDIEFIGVDDKITTNYSYPLHCNTIANNINYDLIIVPGFDDDPKFILDKNKEVVKWIAQQYKHGAKIASTCTGTVLLAQSGILKNKKAATHWLIAESFRNMYKEIELCSNDVMLDLGDIFMSGGATSFQNLMVYLIEKFMDRTIAIGVSKLYLIDVNKDNQHSYATMYSKNNHHDREIKKAQSIIEQMIANKISVAYLANEICMSKRNFMRRFKKATGDTVWQYIQKMKVEKAKEILETNSKSFEEIVEELGYEDVNSFRKIFVKYTGVLPSHYKKRYSYQAPEHA